MERSVPDIALVDISLKDDNGLDLVRTIRKIHPGVPVLIVTMHDEIVYAERAMKAGARGLVMKQEAPEIILEAIRTVLSGKVYLSDRMNERLIESMFSSQDEGESSPVERLSERETEVLEYIGRGFGAAEIARTLSLSVKTINSYQEHLKEKLGLESSADVRRFAISWCGSVHR
jgi:DNA-binding NarL/FixJ family response regulator